MKVISAVGSMLASMLVLAGPTQAQGNLITFVSGNGSDNNSCVRDAPCLTFSGAIAKTAVNGEMNCLDVSGFGSVVITKSITIDCHGLLAGSYYLGGTGVTIQFDSFNTSTDITKTVRLRNINFNGVQFSQSGVRITGAVTDTTVLIEDCVIDGNAGGNARGIDDARTGSGRLLVNNTTIRNNSGAGISVLPAGGASNIQVLLNNVRSLHNGTGAQFGNLTRVAIDQSAFTANAGAGILTVAGAIVSVDRSTITHNANGLQTSGGGTITVANSNIQFNTSQGVNASGGSVLSFGNNRIAFNASPGTVPTAAGAVSNDLGQQ
jgi:hypothetical protein